MATNTGVKTSALIDAANRLRELVPDDLIQSFEDWYDLELVAGDPRFAAAQWFDDVVADRRAGLVVHAQNLQNIFRGLAAAVTHIAESVSGTDSTAANDLQATASNAISGWIDAVNKAEQDLPETKGEDDYDSDDTDGPAPELLYEVKADGEHEVDEDRNVVLDLAQNNDDLPESDALDAYNDLITDVNERAGNPDAIDDGLIFSDDTQVIKPDDPQFPDKANS